MKDEGNRYRQKKRFLSLSIFLQNKGTLPLKSSASSLSGQCVQKRVTNIEKNGEKGGRRGTKCFWHDSVYTSPLFLIVVWMWSRLDRFLKQTLNTYSKILTNILTKFLLELPSGIYFPPLWNLLRGDLSPCFARKGSLNHTGLDSGALENPSKISLHLALGYEVHVKRRAGRGRRVMSRVAFLPCPSFSLSCSLSPHWLFLRLAILINSVWCFI